MAAWFRRLSVFRKLLFLFLIIIVTGFAIPQDFKMPVKHACKKDYNQDSFWYYPWGKSGTHKGVDIFAAKGTDVSAATGGIVVYAGEIRMGGKVVFVLGPKWRLHYFAHLSEIKTSSLTFVSCGDVIGKVGDTGNAKGKSPHLHYSINSLFPLFWQIDGAKQGWKKMFYVNPVSLLNEVSA